MTDRRRYHRQMLLAEIGEEGQRRLMDAHALIVGCGALGCVIADSLTRAGVGRLTIIDRDVVELTNLQRQTLYDEEDVRSGLPKAEAARRKLTAVNSGVHIDAVIDDFNHTNAEQIAGDADVLIDGLDNFETRYLLNDLSVSRAIPYVYGGAVATGGMAATFLPHSPDATIAGTRRWTDDQATPCLRCVFEAAPPPGASATCDTVGVLGPIVNIIASIEAAEAIKILTGQFDAISRSLLTVDVWRNEFRRLDISGAYEAADCRCCRHGQFDALAGRESSAATSLCGRNSVQIVPAGAAPQDLESLERRLRPHGVITRNRFMLRAQLSEGEAPIELTVFPNGRAIVQGIAKPELARSIYAKYIGA